MSQDTAKVLESMLKQPTGVSFLDSGSAYGRHWERNQNIDFESVPYAWIDYLSADSKELLITQSVYHFLKERLDYAPEWDRKFRLFAALEDPDNNESWLSLMDRFTDALHKRGAGGIYGEGAPITVNTYNHESTLSQVIQFAHFTYESEGYYILQIHNGCDVRGGYTAPRVFRDSGMYSEPALMFDADLYIRCSEDRNHNWYSDNAGYSWYPGRKGLKDLKDYEWISVETWEESRESAKDLYLPNNHLTKWKGYEDEITKMRQDVRERRAWKPRGMVLVDEADKVIYCPECGAKLQY